MSESRIKEPQMLVNVKHLIEYLMVGGKITRCLNLNGKNRYRKYYIDHNKITEKQVSPEAFDALEKYGLIKEIETNVYEGTIKPKVKLMF